METEEDKIKEDIKFVKDNHDFLLVRINIRRLCNKYGFRASVEGMEKLNMIVTRLVKEACLKSKLNDRKTVLYRDV